MSHEGLKESEFSRCRRHIFIVGPGVIIVVACVHTVGLLRLTQRTGEETPVNVPVSVPIFSGQRASDLIHAFAEGTEKGLVGRDYVSKFFVEHRFLLTSSTLGLLAFLG